MVPFSSRLIKQTHKFLLLGARGDHKFPGEFRTSQNWIGGASINHATFIPPVQNSILDFRFGEICKLIRKLLV